jgi:hypothetical protein
MTGAAPVSARHSGRAVREPESMVHAAIWMPGLRFTVPGMTRPHPLGVSW